MANRSQNSPFGLFRKEKAIITTGSFVTLTGTSITATTLGYGSQTITEDSTSGGMVFGSPASALPSHDAGAVIAMGENSTGHFAMINTTGTTWKYLNVTSDQPT